MAIFNNSDSTHQNSKPDTNTTIITTGATLKGEMNLSCNLYVDGEFEGIISSKKDINIGKNGHIKGDVITQRLVVQGFIEGNINAQRIEIKANGKVSGSIEYGELIIEAKGILEGKSTLKNSQKTPEVKKIQLNQS